MPRERTRLFLEIAAFVVVAALVVAFAVRRGSTPERTTEHRFMMGTIVAITVFADDAEPWRDAVESAFREIERVEALTTRYAPSSEVSRVNARADGVEGPAAGEDMAIDVELASLLDRALRVAEASGGAFDPTVGPLVDLWPLDEMVALPETGAIEDALDRVDHARVGVDTAAGLLAIPPGFAIDLDGIAKGYAVDRAIDALREHGIEAALVDAGGDIGLLGASPSARGWRVGVKHPREEGILGVVTLSEGSVATSGDYQRYVTIDGVRYHHLLDPATGYPTRGVLSVTVIAPRATEADAFATAVFVLGPERGLALVEASDGVEAVIVTGVDTVGEVLVSEGLRGRFTRKP